MRPFTLTEVMDWACVTLTHCSRFSRSSFYLWKKAVDAIGFILILFAQYYQTISELVKYGFAL